MIINTLNTDVQEETWENEEKETKGMFCKSRVTDQQRIYITRNDISNCSSPDKQQILLWKSKRL